MKKFEFKCSSCGEIHEGIPTFGAKYPMNVLYVPEEQRDDLVDLGDNECVFDGTSFYLRGCIEIPVKGYDENFIWGAWVTVRKEDFTEYVSFSNGDRSTLGPYYGYLNGHFLPYEEDWVFRSIVPTDSGPSCPAIPVHRAHPFRSIVPSLRG